MDVYINSTKIKLNPTQSIGKGGEADVFDIGNNQAVKIFKPPDHPDYQGLPHEQQAAQVRISEHQQKLRQFPTNLPSRVITPEALATDKKGQKILGYAMPLLKGAEVLLKYSDRTFRQTGIPHQNIVQIFQDLHNTIDKIHKTGVIIGDFNDLNVLVLGTEAYLIDADSFQYDHFYCRVFTSRFVDPLLCDSQQTKPVLQQPHTLDSDWYAYAVMLMQCLLFVDPYGGVYRPQDPSKRIPHDARPLHRITVFNSEVKYPKPAIPYQVLPDELLHYFEKIFTKDLREKFRRSLLDNLQWTTCIKCGTEHARNTCPNCTHAAPSTTKLLTIVRGTVTATKIFVTDGVILLARVEAGKLFWLYYNGGEFKRENEAVIFSGDLEPQLQFRLQEKATLIAKQGQVITLIPGESPQRLAVDSFGNIASFDVNESTRYWIYNGQLLRDGKLGAEYIGDVLLGQTRFWVGEKFGFGFYRAGNLSVAFVFDTNRKGLCDRIQLPSIQGQIIDANCTFTPERCWFFLATQAQGKTINYCTIIRSDGTVEATTTAAQNDNSWLSTIHGKCAAANFLLSATDEGIVRVEPDNGQIIKTKEFPDTEPFVNTNSQLFPSPQGLYIVNQKEIYLLKIS